MNIIEFKPIEGTAGAVRAYIHRPITEMTVHRKKYPTIVVCPGGGYQMVSQRESDPVAMEYLSAGYNVFILTYSVGSAAKAFTPIKELSATVIKIREMADQWGCDEDKIAVCGFSAGGHLAATLGTVWNNPRFKAEFNTKGGMNKPNAVILSYPVILAGEFAHSSSIANVSGGLGADELDFFSLEKRVDSDTAPTFIWHTAEDDCVPVENTISLISALQKNKISYECHIFPWGGHGISVCTDECGSPDEHNRQWVKLSKNWLNKLFNYKL